MNRIQAKLRSQRGETLVELMAAILISTLSVGLLLGGVAVSANINRQAQNTDAAFYHILSAAESRQVPASGGVAADPSIQVREHSSKTVEIPVQVYGDSGLYAYALPPTGGGLP